MSTNHEKYILKITAGAGYDTSTHQRVPVNKAHPVTISSAHLTTSLSVRIQDYRGLASDSPATSPYFSHPTHTHDRYSIAFSFVPKENIAGDQLVFGNDFDRPIRDNLPPGFSYALKIAKWTVDPGLETDAYADKPWLFGPLLSSINVLRIGGKGGNPDIYAEVEKDQGQESKVDTVGEGDEKVPVFQEGADNDGEEVREKLGIPDTGPQRMKYFLDEQKRKDFVFEKGRRYDCDFFNPYLDFNDFSLRLPGFSLSILRYWDGQPLRYVLKNKATNQVLLVVLFTLLPIDESTSSPDSCDDNDDHDSKPNSAPTRNQENTPRIDPNDDVD